MSQKRPLHVVIGAGQIGSRLAEVLAARGLHVRLARRGSSSTVIPGVDRFSGDITDRAFADRLCAGAAVIYNCSNPPYHRWPELLPPLFDAAQAAATRNDARLVVLDNLYMYGAVDGPMREQTPLRPTSKKGALRARVAGRLFEAVERGELRATAGRASDFFGPGIVNAAVFSPRGVERLLDGKPLEMIGDPDMPHAYSFREDVAQGLATLGTDERADGRAWHLPVASQVSTRELAERIAGASARMRVMPMWMLRSLGLVVPVLREVAEMAYQWQQPFLVDDSDFRKTFGVEPTAIDAAAQATAGGAAHRRAA